MMHTPERPAQTYSTAHPASAPRAPRRAFSRLRTRRHFVPLLVGITLLGALAVVVAAYFGARADATATAQDRTTASARMAVQILAEQGGSLTLTGTTLTVGQVAAPLTLNNDPTVVDKVHSITGQDATIYALEGTNLVAVASNLPQVDHQGQPVAGSRALGATLTGPAVGALLSQCGPVAQSGATCHMPYTGVASLQGVDYVAAFQPLFDTNGSFVGAMSVAQPLADVVAPSLELAVILALVALLAAVLALLLGLVFSGSLSDDVLRKLDARLGDMAANAAELEYLARSQVARVQRQDRSARQVSEASRELDSIMEAMEQGQAALRQATSEIWSGMSQPGQALDPAMATRLARQAAVTAGRIGAANEDARERTRSLIAIMNQVIAEARQLGEGGRETEERASALRLAIEKVEMTLGAQVIDRQYDLPGLPFARNAARISRRVGHLLGHEETAGRGSAISRPLNCQRPALRASSAYPRVAPASMPFASGMQRAAGGPRMPDTGQTPAINPQLGYTAWMKGPSGHLPAAHQSSGHLPALPRDDPMDPMARNRATRNSRPLPRFDGGFAPQASFPGPRGLPPQGFPPKGDSRPGQPPRRPPANPGNHWRSGQHPAAPGAEGFRASWPQGPTSQSSSSQSSSPHGAPDRSPPPPPRNQPDSTWLND